MFENFYPMGMLDRDQRTTITLPKQLYAAECTKLSLTKLKKLLFAYENCDKCEERSGGSNKNNNTNNNDTIAMDCSKNIYKFKQRVVKTFYIKKFVSFILLVLISVYIMSSSKAEAVPISSSSSSSTSTTNERINNQSILLPDCIRGQRRNQTAMSHAALKERLGTIISTCDIALQSAKYLSESYVKKLWGEDVMKHHNSWSHHNITWLFPGPDHHPLRKNFREKMHKEHEREMNMTDWNSDKIVEYLGKIYRRFQRIAIGIAIVNQWNELATQRTIELNEFQLRSSKSLFHNAQEKVNSVLCEIHSALLDMSVDPHVDLDIKPLQMDEYIKLQHWLIYREYENLLDYSTQLLNIIKSEKHNNLKKN